MKKHRSKKKTRRVVHWKAVLVLLLFLNIFIGLLYSPMTSLRRIRVVGAKEEDRSRIASHLRLLQGVPVLKVNPTRLESLILANDEIANADLRANIFGVGVLHVYPRIPCAVLDGRHPRCLSREGAFFSVKEVSETLPRICVPEAMRFINISFAGGWEAKKMVDICQKIKKILPFDGWCVELDTRGVISIKRDHQARIVMGSPEALDKKFEILEKVLKGNSEFLSQIKELNLTAPNYPVMIPLEKPPKS